MSRSSGPQDTSQWTSTGSRQKHRSHALMYAPRELDFEDRDRVGTTKDKMRDVMKKRRYYVLLCIAEVTSGGDSTDDLNLSNIKFDPYYSSTDSLHFTFPSQSKRPPLYSRHPLTFILLCRYAPNSTCVS